MKLLRTMLAVLIPSLAVAEEPDAMIGKAAPAFRLPSSQGGEVSLDQLKGKFVVLYFYPKDETPGCIKEACNFRDTKAEYDAVGAVILGVSLDDLDSHHGFASNRKLTFPLLADVDGAAHEAYRVWRAKGLGKNALNVVRSTFLIDPQGIVRRVWRSVDVTTHAADVLKAIGELGGTQGATSTQH